MSRAGALDADLAAQWHPTLNGTLAASSVSAGSERRVWWLGPCGHEWDALVLDRTRRGHGCHVCSGRKIIVGLSDLRTLFPVIATQWHPTKNLPLTQEQVSVKSATKVWWQCKANHEWQASVGNRTGKGSGCPYCSGRLPVEGISDLRTTNPKLSEEWHPTKNGTLKPTDVKAHTNRKVWWLGPCGHEWDDTVSHRNSGRGCPLCAGYRVVPEQNGLAITHAALAAEWHPVKNGSRRLEDSERGAAAQMKAWWLGPCGHEWEATVNSRRSGSTCQVCLGKIVVPSINDLSTTDSLLAAQWHPTLNGTMQPTQITRQSNKSVWWICSKSHVWQTTPASRTGKKPSGCPHCVGIVSKQEHKIAEYLRELGLTVEQSNRKILGNRLELDLYLPMQRVGIEYNGLRWHSEAVKSAETAKEMHHAKYLAAQAVGIQLIQIWEDDWQRRPETVKRALAHKLGVGQQVRVHARQTSVVAVDTAAAQRFLEGNHIQGFAAGSHYLALQTRTGESVALMVLKREPGTAGRTLNIVRYATAANVPGGFTKLLWAAERMYTPERFLTFSDHTISDGGLYVRNGFVKDGEVRPDYMYVVGGERRHKFGYRLKRFRNDPALKFEAGLSERELAALNGLPRIWDAGKTRWVREV